MKLMLLIWDSSKNRMAASMEQYETDDFEDPKATELQATGDAILKRMLKWNQSTKNVLGTFEALKQVDVDEVDAKLACLMLG